MHYFVWLSLLSISTFGQNNFSLNLVGENELYKLITQRDGKILFLNVWATWCLPCREEIPDLNRLYKDYSDKIEVIGLSIDYPEEIEKLIIPFIIKNSVEYPVVVSNFAKDEQLINLLNKEWSGALPASFIYKADGKMVEFIEGKENYANLVQLLKKYIE